jgi:hypothetical protein
MALALDRNGMSMVPKPRLMMEDPSAEKEPLASPACHGGILAERERLTGSGEEEFLDWEVGKKQLREELP